MNDTTEQTLLALEILGDDGLPLPIWDGFQCDPYLTRGDYAAVYGIVTRLLPALSERGWFDATPSERCAYMREALSRSRNSVVETPKPNNQGKQVNARMLEMTQRNPDCRGWTSSQWAKALKCSKPSVVETATWKELAEMRSKLSAERARDRRGTGAGRRRGTYRQD